MSWTENEKLNEWIARAYENGKADEKARLLKRIKEQICFDALRDGYCLHHRSKCKDLLLLLEGEGYGTV